MNFRTRQYNLWIGNFWKVLVFRILSHNTRLEYRYVGTSETFGRTQSLGLFDLFLWQIFIFWLSQHDQSKNKSPHFATILIAQMKNEKVWDIETLQPTQNINNGGGKSSYNLKLAGKYLLAGTYDNNILVFDLKTLELSKTLSGHQGELSIEIFFVLQNFFFVGCVLCLSVSGPYFFSGSYDTTIKVI